MPGDPRHTRLIISNIDGSDVLTSSIIILIIILQDQQFKISTYIKHLLIL
jgi:hypothetical protein